MTAVSLEPLRSALVRVAPVKSMVEEPYKLPSFVAVSSEPLRSASVRLASLKSIRLLPKPPSAVSFEPLRSVWVRPAPFSLIAPAPMGVASLKSP